MEGEDEIALAPMLEKKVAFLVWGRREGGGRKKEPTNTDRGGGGRKSVAFKRHISLCPLFSLSLSRRQSLTGKGGREKRAAGYCHFIKLMGKIH